MYMLGMYLATDVNNKDKVKYMHKKAPAWATSVRAGGVQQNKARKAFNSEITQTRKYPLPIIMLNEEECKHIMQSGVKFGLTKAGISSTLDTEVRYGPRSLGGIGLFYPFAIQ